MALPLYRVVFAKGFAHQRVVYKIIAIFDN
jgi:hypothetical protein